MPQFKYVNAQNASIDLNDQKKSWTRLDSLRRYDWEASTTRRPGGKGGRASGFGRWPKELPFKTYITCETVKELNAWQDSFQAVTEPDIFAQTPGKLYIDDQYLTCYIRGGETEEYNVTGCFAVVSYTVLAVEPYWCTEVTYSYNLADEGSTDETGKKYNLRYPYRYGTGLLSARLINTHYTACPAIITIYGPCTDPVVTINNIPRQVNTSLLGSERLVINQVDHTIQQIDSTGGITNVFNLRNKAYDIFSEVPAGEVQFSYSGEYKIDVTLIEQRSMPRWS